MEIVKLITVIFWGFIIKLISLPFQLIKSIMNIALGTIKGFSDSLEIEITNK